MTMKKLIIIAITISSLIILGYLGVEYFHFEKIFKKESVVIEKEFLYNELENGDIIFQTSKSRQSRAIQLATNSKYSHMGIVYKKRGKLFVYEAVQPVKLTPLTEWIKRGEKNHFVAKRIKNAKEILTPETIKKLMSAGEKYKGKNYDIHFEWSDEKIYCSELVWKMYKEATGIEIGKLQKLSEFDLSNELVRKIMAERYGEKIPLDEDVISPVSMFNADNLITILEN